MKQQVEEKMKQQVEEKKIKGHGKEHRSSRLRRRLNKGTWKGT